MDDQQLNKLDTSNERHAVLSSSKFNYVAKEPRTTTSKIPLRPNFENEDYNINKGSKMRYTHSNTKSLATINND